MKAINIYRSHKEAIYEAVFAKRQDIIDEIKARVTFDIEPLVQEAFQKMKK